MNILTRAACLREALEFDEEAARCDLGKEFPRALFLLQRAQVYAALALVSDETRSELIGSRGPGMPESRECVIAAIGAAMPGEWDFARLAVEFVEHCGLPIEEASLPDLKDFLDHLGRMRHHHIGADLRGSEVPPW